MILTFDLISNLDLDNWKNFNWSGLGTSQICVVAGDVATNRNITINALHHLSQCYNAVLYIDGSQEHLGYMDNISRSYQDLANRISILDNVTYLQDNVAIMHGVAFVATNGWWAFDFAGDADPNEAARLYQQDLGLEAIDTVSILQNSITDAAYLSNTIAQLQHHPDVKKIVIITNSVPRPSLISHDHELSDTWKFNIMGNRLMSIVQEHDSENKIDTWCFGRYLGAVDQVHDGVRYVNHSRGNTAPNLYYPKRLTIRF